MGVHPIDALGSLSVGVGAEMIGTGGQIAAGRQVQPQVAVVGWKGTGEKGESQNESRQRIIEPGARSVAPFRRGDGRRRQENAIRRRRLRGVSCYSVRRLRRGRSVAGSRHGDRS